MKIKRLILLLLLSLSLFISAVADCFSQPDNYKFYPHDYAKSPLDGSTEPIIETDQDNEDSQRLDRNKISNGKSQGDQQIFKEIDGRKIEGLSLVTSGLDYKSLLKELELLISIFNSKRVQPSRVYLIGDSSERKPKELKDILKRVAMLAAEITYDIAPPSNFKIEKVPSWILSLEKGDVVLEGIESPNMYINSKGQFMDPKSVGAPQL